MVLYNYKQILKDSYVDLKSINPDFKVFSIAQIEWWLMKYYDLFKLVTGTYTTLCENCMVLEDENLPIDCLSNPEFCNKKVEFKTFIGFYNTLDEVTQIHRLDNKCYMAYDAYTFLVCVDEDVSGWVKQYCNLGMKLSMFYYNYLDYSGKEDEKDLHIVNAPDNSFGVMVNRGDFKNILKFYEVFSELFWNQKLYPEKLEELKEQRKLIKFPKKDINKY